jgi:hypothetical protein
MWWNPTQRRESKCAGMRADRTKHSVAEMVACHRPSTGTALERVIDLFSQWIRGNLVVQNVNIIFLLVDNLRPNLSTKASPDVHILFLDGDENSCHLGGRAGSSRSSHDPSCREGVSRPGPMIRHYLGSFVKINKIIPTGNCSSLHPIPKKSSLHSCRLFVHKSHIECTSPWRPKI